MSDSDAQEVPLRMRVLLPEVFSSGKSSVSLSHGAIRVLELLWVTVPLPVLTRIKFLPCSSAGRCRSGASFRFAVSNELERRGQKSKQRSKRLAANRPARAGSTLQRLLSCDRPAWSLQSSLREDCWGNTGSPMVGSEASTAAAEAPTQTFESFCRP